MIAVCRIEWAGLGRQLLKPFSPDAFYRSILYMKF